MEEQIFTSLVDAGLFFRIPLAMFFCMSLVFFALLFMGGVGGAEGGDIGDVGDIQVDTGSDIGLDADIVSSGWFGGLKYAVTSIGLYITSTIAAAMSVIIFFNNSYFRTNYTINDIGYGDILLTISIIVFSLYAANYITKIVFEIMSKTKSETINSNSFISSRVVVNRIYPFEHNGNKYIFGIASLVAKGSNLGVSQNIIVVIPDAEYKNEEYYIKTGLITGIYEDSDVVRAWNSDRGIIDQSVETVVYTIIED